MELIYFGDIHESKSLSKVTGKSVDFWDLVGGTV